MIWHLLGFVRKMTIAVLSIGALLVFLYYMLQVSYRYAGNTWYTEFSDHDGGLYTVKYAYVSENWISLRLYRTGEDVLLAERTYEFVGGRDFTWTDDVFIYDTSDDSFYYQGHIRLPPTHIDRWLARLP